MALHAAAMMAFFMDQAQQAPIQIQCVQQAAPDSWVKWLLPTIVQTVVSLASITAGVLIALWSFRKTKELTEWSFRSTSERDHERWVLDQKKAEWSGLLKATAEVQRVLRVVNTPNKERIERIVEELKPAVQELSVASANCLFLQDFFLNSERREKFYSFIKDADDTSELISGLRTVQRYPDSPPTQQESSDLVTKILNETGRITMKYLEFNEWLRKEAAEDLGITSSEKSGEQE